MKSWDNYVESLDPATRRQVLQTQYRAQILVQLIEAREALGWTQEELAKKCGMRQSAIARLEGGEVMPQFGTLLIIAKALGFRLALIPDSFEDAAAEVAVSAIHA